MCVAGARPNFVKVKPVIDRLEALGVDVTFVHTGQHYDDTLDAEMFRALCLRAPDHELGVGSGSHAEQVARVLLALEPLVGTEAPDVLVVVGDVNSTLAAALVGAKAGVGVAHVESGLRSGDWSMPEEVNRVVVDRVSDLLLAPSDDAVSNLRAEGMAEGSIALVGNVMIDTLLARIDEARERPVLSALGLARGEFVLATLHRPATVDDVATLDRVLGAVAEGAAGRTVVLPVHPRTARRLQDLRMPSVVHVMPAMGYLDFLALEDGAAVVVTDSGGVQEETTVLGVACVTVRETTERPVTCTLGTNELVGLDPGAIGDGIRRALRGRVGARIPALWDGHAAERAVTAIIERWGP